MYPKYVKSASFLLVGIFSIIVGILIIYQNIHLYSAFIKLVSVVFFISGLSLLGKGLLDKEKRPDIWRGMFNVTMGFLMLLFPKIPTSLLPLLFALYLLVSFAIDFISYLVLKKNKVSGRFITLLKAILFLFLSIPLLFAPLMSLKYVLILLGVYLILFGLSSIVDFSLEWISPSFRSSFKKKISVSLPIFITTFIPYSILKDINAYLAGEKEMPKRKGKKNEEVFDLEVLVHVSNADSVGTIGHADLWYNGEIISYGNYDMRSRKLKDTLGDGVLFICKDKQKYIDFCQKHNKKILFGFGIRLTEREKKKVEKAVSILKENTYEWVPYYKRALLGGEEVKESDYTDYVSTLYKMTSADFYKFYEGKFKTFFIFTTNCVALTDTILGAAGAGIMKPTGFISPGSYYDYLYKEYCRKNSRVVSYKIYTQSGDFYE